MDGNTDQENQRSTSIFLTQNSEVAGLSSNHITYTSVLDSIPKGRQETPTYNWQTKYGTEWRWRFLDLPNGRSTVEISYTNSDNMVRKYFNRSGEWVQRDVSSVYDKYVTQVLYYYSEPKVAQSNVDRVCPKN